MGSPVCFDDDSLIGKKKIIKKFALIVFAPYL